MKKLINAILAVLALWVSTATADDGVAVVRQFIGSYTGVSPVVTAAGKSDFLVAACGHREKITFTPATRGRMAQAMRNPRSGARLGTICPNQAAAVTRLISACLAEKKAAAAPAPAPGVLSRWSREEAARSQAILAARVDPVSSPVLGETRLRVSRNHAWGQVGAAFVGGAWGAAAAHLRRSDRYSLSAVATGGAATSTSTATGGAGGNGYGGNTVINPPSPRRA